MLYFLKIAIFIGFDVILAREVLQERDYGRALN